VALITSNFINESGDGLLIETILHIRGRCGIVGHQS